MGYSVEQLRSADINVRAILDEREGLTGYDLYSHVRDSCRRQAERTFQDHPETLVTKVQRVEYERDLILRRVEAMAIRLERVIEPASGKPLQQSSDFGALTEPACFDMQRDDERAGVTV